MSYYGTEGDRDFKERPYPCKIGKVKDRMEYFRKVRKRWEEKTDIWE